MPLEENENSEEKIDILDFTSDEMTENSENQKTIDKEEI